MVSHDPSLDLSATPSRASPAQALAGIGLMIAAIFVFSFADALGKWLLGTYSVGQLLLIRSITALLALGVFIRRDAKTFAIAPRPGLQLLRVAFATGDVVCFFWAVSVLPLADVMTYYLAGPIFVTAISATVLGERVGWRRWLAVAVGFAGVLVALRPATTTFTLPALIALLGSLSFSLSLIATRHLRGTSDTVLVTTQTLGTLAVGLVLAPVAWVTPSPIDAALLVLIGVVSTIAHVCVNRSLKLAPASVVTPFQYTMIVWAVVFGYLVFGDVPDAATVIGASIIIAAGLFIFWREQRHAARAGE